MSRFLLFSGLIMIIFFSSCSDEPDAIDNQISELRSTVQKQNREIKTLQGQIEGLNKSVSQRDIKIRELEGRITWAKENFRINFPDDKVPVTGDISKEVFGNE